MATYVNGTRLDPRVVDREREELRARYASRTPDNDLEAFTDKIDEDGRMNAIEKMLLREEAAASGIHVTQRDVDTRLNTMKRASGGPDAFHKEWGIQPGDEKLLQSPIKDRLQYERYLESLCDDVAAPADEACREYYDAHREQFQLPVRVHAAHIVRQPSAARPAARLHAELLNVREKLLKGEDFHALATAASDCPENGGDLGWIGPGRVVEEFERVVFALQPGDISDVFQTSFGFHIATVIERREPETPTYVQVRQEIRDLLANRAKNECIGRRVDELLADAVIEERDDPPDEQSG